MNRKYILFVLLSVVLAVLPTGCQNPFPADTGESAIRSGRKICTSLSVAPADGDVAVKSSFTGSDGAVANYNLLVFEDGVLAAKYYKDSAGDLAFEVVAGHPYDYRCVANVGDVTAGFAVGATTVSTVDAWRLETPVAGATGLPMAWRADGVTFSSAQLKAGARLEIPLTRLVAQYDIVIEKSALARYDFTASALSVCGPAAVTPFTTSRAAASAVRTDYALAQDLQRLNGGNTAVFYPLENRYGMLLPGNADPWRKIPESIPETDHPTYIELEGQATMTDGSALGIPVKYRFYLGANATTDFDVKRNSVYTVTLCLTDAAIERSEPSWKVEKGAYTDDRSLVFSIPSLQLKRGGSSQAGVVRHPAGLKYIVSLDASLTAAGISVTNATPGAVTDLDQLTFAATASGPRAEGTVTIRTLDGKKSSTLAVSTAPQLVGLEVFPATVYLPGVATRPPSSYSTWEERSFTVTARYDDGSGEDVSASEDTEWETYMLWYGQPFDLQGFDPLTPSRSTPATCRIYRYYGNGYSDLYTRWNQWYDTLEHPESEVTEETPRVMFQASYTSDGQTLTADVLGTIVNNAAPVGITVEPASQEADAGGHAVQYAATMLYDDGMTEDVTETATWSADGLATSEGQGRFVTGTSTGSTTVRARQTVKGVTVEGTATLTVRPRTLAQLELQIDAGSGWTSNDCQVNQGSTQKWRLKLSYTNGDSEYLVRDFTLTSSDASVVSVNGITTNAEAVGSACIQCNYGGLTSNTVTLTVMNHNYTHSLSVTPSQTTLTGSGTVSYRAIFKLFDNGELVSQQDVTGESAWSLDDALQTVASIGSDGRLSASNTGTTAVSGTVTASYNSEGRTYSGQARLTVNPPFVPQLSASPAKLEWMFYQTDAKTIAVTANVSWKAELNGSGWTLSASSGSGNGSFTAKPDEVNTGSSAKTATVRIYNEEHGLSCTVTLTQYQAGRGPGNEPYPYRMAVTPSTATIDAGATYTFTGTMYIFSDAAMTQLFHTLVNQDFFWWYSSDDDVARTGAGSSAGGHYGIHNGATVKGYNTGTEDSSATISVSFGRWGRSSAEDGHSAVLTVRGGETPGPEVTYRYSLEIRPSSLTLDVGATGSLAAWYITKKYIDGVYDSQTEENVTASASWSSSDGSVATVSGGSVTARSAGTARITATKSGESATATVTVNAVDELLSIAFNKASYELVHVEGGTVVKSAVFRVTARYSLSGTVDITSTATYTDQGCVEVRPSAGTLTATAVCSDKTITASYGGKTATATYSAEDLAYPTQLSLAHFESQGATSFEFSGTLDARFTRAISGTTWKEESVQESCTLSPSSLIVIDSKTSVAFVGHFREAGEGYIICEYTSAGVTVSCRINLVCDTDGNVRKR